MSSNRGQARGSATDPMVSRQFRTWTSSNGWKSLCYVEIHQSGFDSWLPGWNSSCFKAYGNSGSMRIEVNKLLACSGRMLLSTSSRMKAHIFCLPAWRTWSKSVTCWLGSLFLLAMLSAPDSCSCMPIVHGKPGWKHTWVESKYCGRRKNI